MTAEEYHQQELEARQEALEARYDSAREEFTRYDVRCSICGVKVRTSQWQNMTSRCPRCADRVANESMGVGTFSGHSQYKP